MKYIVWAILSGIIAITSATAASISTYPMRIELEEGNKIASLTVFNSGDKSVNIQVRAVKWWQDKKNGNEQTEDTKELIYFPRIFSIPARGQQVVRVGYKGKVGAREKSFRLLVRELPVDKPGQFGARFAVEISSPAFIYPKGAIQPTKPELKGIEVLDGVLVARIENHGSRYYSMQTLKISGSKAGANVFSKKITGWYVLAGISKPFALRVSHNDCMQVDQIHLIAHTKSDQSEAYFPVFAALCGGIATARVTAAQ